MATKDTVATLYGGKHTVVYKNGNHRYYVEGQAVPSVTTVMSAVLAKPDLMLWPLNMALKYLGERLPNITVEDLNMARSAHVRRREDGANTGTAVHYLSEQRLRLPYNKKLNLDTATVPQDVAVAAQAFENWVLRHKPTVIGVEQIVYSPSENYVGTYDSILKIDGRVVLCDIKTTNAARNAPKGIYPEHFIQMGAYYTAYEEQRRYEIENFGKTELEPIEDLMVISVKKTGVVDTMTASSIGLTLPELEATWRSIMTVYAQINTLKQQIGGKK